MSQHWLPRGGFKYAGIRGFSEGRKGGKPSKCSGFFQGLKLGGKPSKSLKKTSKNPFILGNQRDF